MSEVSNALVPFTSERIGTDSWDSVLFSLGNIGLKLRVQAGSLPHCLSIFVTPLTLSNIDGVEDWDVHHQYTKELILPIHPQEPLLQFARQPFDHVQWGSKYVKLFWNREVLKIEVKKENENYHLYFKKMYWDGVQVNWRDNCRKTFAVDEKQYDYSLNLATALSKEEYLEYQKEQQELEEIRKLIPPDPDNYDNSKAKESVNKLLGYIGLQLKESE